MRHAAHHHDQASEIKVMEAVPRHFKAEMFAVSVTSPRDELLLLLLTMRET